MQSPLPVHSSLRSEREGNYVLPYPIRAGLNPDTCLGRMH